MVKLGIKNKFKPSLIIEKVDTEGNPLTNAEFEVRRTDGALVTRGVTNRGGMLSVANLAPGAYEVTETRAPQGFAIAKLARVIEITANQTATERFVSHRNKNKRFLSAFAVFAVSVLILTTAMTTTPVLADNSNPHQTNGFANSNGRPDTVNINDHSTSVWNRFSYNYRFSSGADHRHIFGTPTHVSERMMMSRLNIMPQNIRSDRNVSAAPLPYGIFSAIIDTYNANPFFATWVNDNGGLSFVLDNPGVLAEFDTLGLGINNQDWLNPNPMNIQNFNGNGGFMSPTSVGE